MISQYLPRIGGIENVVSDLSRKLVRAGHDVSVIAPRYDKNDNSNNVNSGNTIDNDTNVNSGSDDGTTSINKSSKNNRVASEGPEMVEGVKVYRFGTSRGFPMGLDELRNMYNLTLQAHSYERFDIIHSHFAKNEGLVGIRAGRKLGIPVVTTVHGSDIMDVWGGMCERPWSRYWVRRVLKGSYRLSAVSGFLKERVLEHGIPQAKVRVIHNWIDPGDFTFNPAPNYQKEQGTWKDNANCDRGSNGVEIADRGRVHTFKIVTARRLVRKNGVDLLLSSLDHLVGTRMEGRYLLHILSDGPLKAELQGSVKGTPHEDLVTFHGSVSFQRYLLHLRDADAWIVPSRWEGFGMVVLEAFAAGTPVVATNVGGIPEIIRHGQNGILVEPDPKAIACGIGKLYEDPALRSSLVENGKSSVSEYFNFRRGIREWVEYYSDIIDDYSNGRS